MSPGVTRIAGALLLLVCLDLPASPGDPKYPVDAIPEKLKQNANAVVREDQMVFTISSSSSAKLHVYFAATILNEKARNFSFQYVNYDKLRKVTSINGAIYNAKGELIKRLKNSDFIDRSAFDGMYSDNRAKIADLSSPTYPYTVEFEYDLTYKYLFNIDGTTIIPGGHVGVEHAFYQIIYPAELKPRYRAYNISQKPEITSDGKGNESVTWDFRDMKPIPLEPYISEAEVLPHIDAAPTQFEYDGYQGRMDTWESFGQWIKTLNDGRGVLPEKTRMVVARLTTDLNSTEEKARVLYEYIQNRTRYVSIQLGIGGYQPFEARVVDETGYGDCKALSNYMVALLAEAGVKANYTLILAGRDRDDIDADFPSSQFNHVVVSIPNSGDTLWLECTSQSFPFGYLGRFTSNRHALSISDDGARIVKTPAYPPEDNIQSRSAVVKVEPDGNAVAKVTTSLSGLQYENGGLAFVIASGANDQEKWIREDTQIPNFDLVHYAFKQQKERIPVATVELDLHLRSFASVSGKRMFITPNLMNRSTFIPENNDDRQAEYTRRWGFVDYDTITYELPESLYPEFLPEPVKISSSFGEYESTISMVGGKVVFIRKLMIRDGRFPASGYPELSEFYRKINKADNGKLVLLNKT